MKMHTVSVIFPSSWPKLKIARTYEWRRPQIPSLFYLPMNLSRIAMAKVRLRSTEGCWALCLSNQAQGGDLSVNKSPCADMTHLMYLTKSLSSSRSEPSLDVTVAVMPLGITICDRNKTQECRLFLHLISRLITGRIPQARYYGMGRAAPLHLLNQAR